MSSAKRLPVVLGRTVFTCRLLSASLCTPFTCRLLSALLYMDIGRGLTQTAAVTQAAVIFMWVVFPSFGAAVYTPILVLERPLFYRCCTP